MSLITGDAFKNVVAVKELGNGGRIVHFAISDYSVEKTMGQLFSLTPEIQNLFFADNPTFA